jgi:hypothetical protein
MDNEMSTNETTIEVYVPGRVDVDTGVLARTEEGTAYSTVEVVVTVDDDGHVSFALGEVYAAPGVQWRKL